MTTIYEWAIEEFDAYGDIINSDFHDNLASFSKEDIQECFKEDSYFQLCLIRRTGSETGGEIDRETAYFTSSTIPPREFESGVVIPRRLINQFKKMVS